MRRFLVVVLGGALVACSPPQVRVTLLSLADGAPNPRVDLEFTIFDGEQFAFGTIPNEPLPIIEVLTFPEETELLPLHIEVRALVGEREIARGAVNVPAGQTEATIRFSVCSNGAQEALEACDDGGLIDGDGCDSTCKPTGCASGVATPGELCFAESDDLVGPDNPLQVLAADLNGDELPDLVAPYGSLSSPGAVRIFPNAAGSFAAFDEIPVLGVKHVVLGDLDGDRDLDIVASVDQPTALPGLVILTNEGGAFSVGTETPLAALDVGTLGLGDIDGDGRLDLIFTDKSAGLLKVNLGEEGGGFGSQSQALSVGAQPVALSLADIDADGDVDVVTANVSSSVSVLLNDGGVLVPKPPFSVGSGIPSSLVLGEFDTEEGIDLAVTKQDNGTGKVQLLKGTNTDEGFLFVANFDLGVQPSALIAADLDLDGDLDLAATNQSEATIQVLFNKGGCQFDAPLDATGGLFDTRLAPVSLAVSDLNADGVPDLVAAGQNLGLLLSNP